MILGMDMEENTWRTIDRPSGFHCYMHQAQDHLCICTVDGPNESELSIWILEDYSTNNWTLKHTVTTRIMFGRINIRFSFPDFVDECIVITQELNLIFFAEEHGTIITYDMDRRRVRVIPARVFRYDRHNVKKEFTCRPYYLPYIPLFSDSLAEH
jgi:hypothetical protein